MFSGKKCFNEIPLPHQNLLESKSANLPKYNFFCSIRLGSSLDKKPIQKFRGSEFFFSRKITIFLKTFPVTHRKSKNSAVDFMFKTVVSKRSTEKCFAKSSKKESS